MPSYAPPRPTPRAGPREWAGLAVLSLPLLVLALDVSVLFLAAPQLVADLRPSGAQTLWIMDIYGFVIAGFLVTMGTLGDRLGRRRLLLTGGAVFAVASVLTAYATSAETLIAARALLGVAGATLMPSTLSLISTMFLDARQRARAIAIWMTMMTVGVAIGPLVGGAMLEHFWWGSVFLLAVPVMAVLLALGPVLLPEYRDPRPGPLDMPSIALSLAALLPVVHGLKHLASEGPGPVTAVSVAAGVLCGVLFVRRQRGLAHPLLDLSLFSNRSFSVALGLLLFGLVAINGVQYIAPQYFQLVAGMSPLRAGLWMLPVILAATAGMMLAPPLARRFGAARVMTGGALLSVAGFALVSQVDPTGGLSALVTGAAVAIAGISPLPVLTTELVVAAAPLEKTGSAAAMSETSGELGVGLGVALNGSLVAAVFGARTASEPAAGDDLASTLTAAGTMPSPAGDELTATARDAFTAGLNMVGVAGGALMLLLAVGAGWALRGARSTADDATNSAADDDAIDGCGGQGGQGRVTRGACPR
ncbi:MFS transporter [Streptomyces sp. SID4919]|uniref:MFS transporter n=1 Tax=unclassified Streptomyces TaxID=2593676 RepID=UPI000823DA52|nr:MULTISPECIES: MFS transporter [unclassified Streptomyces]MYY09334.1 MFS transporter [Streptomyces sp. SID4919]SCK42832.1 MFS transporter, DHA2 family, multidrug resistance protein [Streptomyces sp. AmelKG-E11A]